MSAKRPSGGFPESRQIDAAEGGSQAGFHLMSLGRELQISMVWLEVKDL